MKYRNNLMTCIGFNEATTRGPYKWANSFPFYVVIPLLFGHVYQVVGN